MPSSSRSNEGLAREVSDGPVKGAIIGFLWGGKRADHMTPEELVIAIQECGVKLQEARTGKLKSIQARSPKPWKNAPWDDARKSVDFVDHYERVLSKLYEIFDKKMIEAEEK